MPDQCPQGEECPDGFVAPSTAVQADWRTVVSEMMNGHWVDISLPQTLFGIYSLKRFHDNANGQDYCVLMEIQDCNQDGTVEKGWGTFIVNTGATRELSIHVPHPIADAGTAEQGIRVFKDIATRSFLMAGTHRAADTTPSACQDGYTESDVAHNVTNLFQPTIEELVEFYGAEEHFVAIQFHGMAALSCPDVDVYMSYGLGPGAGTPRPGDALIELKSNLLAYHPGWVVTVPGDTPSCGLHGSTNVQGRLLNGVPKWIVCATGASGYSGRFIHIEQDPGFRSAGDWTAPIEDTFPVTP